MWPFTKKRNAEPPAEGNPLPPQLDLSQVRRALVIAPHPDDETIGCGGTLARLAPTCEITVVLVTNGDGGGGLPAGTSEARKAELAQACRTLGIARAPVELDHPDGRFADLDTYRRQLQALLLEHRPEWVFLPWLLDSHADHARIARASCEVLERSAVDRVLHYETWTPVPATHVVDITQTALAKRKALLCHATALQYGDYVEATFGLNAYRGIYLPVRGARWAEAFAVRQARDCLRS